MNLHPKKLDLGGMFFFLMKMCCQIWGGEDAEAWAVMGGDFGRMDFPVFCCGIWALKNNQTRWLLGYFW